MYDYVMSAPAYTRITYKSCWDNEKAKSAINKILKEFQGQHNHYYSLLYNSFVEAPMGKILQNYPEAYHVYADSGGLQMVSRGLDINDEIKQKIYENQAEYSSVAMSFDQIPLKEIIANVDEGSHRLGEYNKFIFDSEGLERCATESARNLNNQIDWFIKSKTKTKPIFIIQGNCISTMCKWAETVLAHIPQEKHEFIAGVSISDKAVGFGIAEDVERLYAYHEIPVPESMKKHVHFLGVGSLRRMLPVAGLMFSGIYPRDTHISYDSTSHTSITSRGKFFSKRGFLTFGRENTVMMYHILQEIQEMFPGYIDDIPYEFFKDIVTLPRKESWANAEAAGQKEIPYYYHMVFFFQVFGSVVNFAQQLDNVSTKKSEYIKACSKKGLTDLQHLPKISNRDDFDYWIKDASKSMKTQRIKTAETSSLEEFFV